MPRGVYKRTKYHKKMLSVPRKGSGIYIRKIKRGGWKLSEETKIKIRNIQIKRVKEGRHNTYKGNDVGYYSLHQWVARRKGHPNKCSQCGIDKTTRCSIQWANIDHKYSRVLEDYIAMCVYCHRKHDSLLKVKG